MPFVSLNPENVASVVSGDLLARIVLPPVTATQLAFYCAATGVTDPIHYDRDFARRAGFPDLVVNGSLRIAWLAQVLADLAEKRGLLEAFSCSHRRPMFVGQAPVLEVRCLRRERASDGLSRVHCEAFNLIDGEPVDVATGILRLAAGAMELSDLDSGGAS